MRNSSSNFEQGDIVTVNFVFAELSGEKRRPALVISATGYNRDSQDLVLLKITSKPQEGGYSVPLSNSDLEHGLLKKGSFILADKPAAISKEIIGAKIARVKNGKVQEAKRKMRALFGI